MIVKIEHVLILVIVAFMLYHLSRCNCGNGFNIGNLTRCFGNNKRICDNLNICNWHEDKCHVIDCSAYDDNREVCISEEKCISLPWNDGNRDRWRCVTSADNVIGSSNESYSDDDDDDDD